MYIAKEKGVLGDWYDQRLEVIDYYHDMSRRIARMRLLGTAAWTKEDYELAFAIKAGYLRLPRGALYLPESYTFDENPDQQVKRGLFNVRRWIKYDVAGDQLRKLQDPFPTLPAGNLAAGDGLGALDVMGPQAQYGSGTKLSALFGTPATANITNPR